MTTVLLFSSSPFNDLCSCCKFNFGLVPSVDLHTIIKIDLSGFIEIFLKMCLKDFKSLFVGQFYLASTSWLIFLFLGGRPNSELDLVRSNSGDCPSPPVERRRSAKNCKRLIFKVKVDDVMAADDDWLKMHLLFDYSNYASGQLSG